MTADILCCLIIFGDVLEILSLTSYARFIGNFLWSMSQSRMTQMREKCSSKISQYCGKKKRYVS